MKKVFGDYFLGLDMGTSSVGWAVTDKNYNVLKFNGKRMWGVRLFEEGVSAEGRRLYRTARRRQARRVERIKLLQELFAEELGQVDPTFFIRMNDSKFLPEDKSENQKNSLFNDVDFDDKSYHKSYPTVYHLRQAFLDGEEITDPRLLYLAILHIVKNRGHFLFDGEEINNENSTEIVFESLKKAVEEELEVELDYVDLKEFEECIKTKSSITAKKTKMIEIFNSKNPKIKELATLLAGGKANLVKMFDIERLEEPLKSASVASFTVASGYDENYDKLADILQDKMRVVECAKAVFDMGLLADILNGKRYLSTAKKEVYEKHGKDLKILKKVVRKYIPEKYDLIFKDTKTEGNYVSYVGMNKKSGKKQVVEKEKCTQVVLCEFLTKQFKSVQNTGNDEDLEYVKKSLEDKTLLPKQVAKENGVIPYQINLAELKAILKNAEKNFDFLNKKDDDGISISEKIIMLFKFKIPYYVGPLNDLHKNNGGNAWIVKRSKEKIYPWNFESIVDEETTAEAFIRKMTNKCTYLVGEDVAPRDSIIYSKYLTLNELNNLRLNGAPLKLAQKQGIYEDLFLKRKKVKIKDIKGYLAARGEYDTKNDDLEGYNGEFKANMSSYVVLKDILKEDFDVSLAENIIKSIVLFGNERKMLKRHIKKISGGKIEQEKIDKLVKLKFAEWGRLSEKFLTQIPDADKESGEVRYLSILDALYNTEDNLMQLLSAKYTFADAVERENENINDVKSFSYESCVESLPVSPAIKRSIWQTLQIVKEIEKVTGHPAEKIFVEVAREKGEKGVQKLSRKARLLDLYRNCKKEYEELYKKLENEEESRLRSDKLYFYYTQLGKCMYTGEKIDLDVLMGSNDVYDIDHIYPQSKVKDDSIQNRVLVCKTANSYKSDKYPIFKETQEKNINHWQLLLQKKLIDKEKYMRLTRNFGFTDDELTGFIARQLVETRQSTKAVAQILKSLYPESRIVYVKAGNVADFKHEYKLVKSREINDYHHAKDAFVNIVVGNVFDVKFTENPKNFIKNPNREKYNIRRMFDYDVERKGYAAWKAGKNGTIVSVEKTYNRNDVLFTRFAHEAKGKLFKVKIMKKGRGQLPIKPSIEKMTLEKYGGYNDVATAYFCLVEHTNKKKRVRTIEYVPIHLSEKIASTENGLDTYLKDVLGLAEHRVIMPKIKLNTLFKIDGFYMHLSGRTGDRLRMKNAMQLVLNKEDYAYCKKVLKCADFVKKMKNDCDVTRYDEEVTKERNELLVKVLKEKAMGCYKAQFGGFGEKIDIEKFKLLSLEEECCIVSDLITAFHCNPESTDLSKIGSYKTAGIILVSKNIANFDSICLINRSVTGLFETKSLDLKKL